MMDIEIEGENFHIPDVTALTDKDWKDDSSLWPTVTKETISKYLIDTPAIDGCPNKANMSLDAIDFYISGWVDRIMVHESKCKTTILLKAEVARSQSTTKEDHKAYVCCTPTGNILTASCSCMAGLGLVCSHISAILFKILEANKLRKQVSCTDLPMVWNSSTRRYVCPEKVRNIRKKKHFLQHDNSLISPSKQFKQFYDHKEMTESIKTNPFSTLMNLNTTLWNQVLNASEVNTQPPVRPQSDHTCQETDYLCLNDPSKLNFEIPCSECKHFYETYVEMSDACISVLSKETTEQSSSELWEDSRKIRLTGSTASKCPKKIDTPPDKFLKAHVHNTFKGNSATNHGVVNEPKAIECFEHITSLSVAKCGTVVAKGDCWLSASPDGLVGDDDVLEVKCPTKNLSELVTSGKYDVRQNEAGNFFLHKHGKNGYYLQVQLNLHCTKRKLCHFFVWGSPSPILIAVNYDGEYVTKELDRLRLFYFRKMLPYVCKEFSLKKLLFGRKFSALMKKNCL